MGVCKCLKCGNIFSVRVVADEPDTNYFETDPNECPSCDSDEIEFTEYECEPSDY